MDEYTDPHITCSPILVQSFRLFSENKFMCGSALGLFWKRTLLATIKKIENHGDIYTKNGCWLVVVFLGGRGGRANFITYRFKCDFWGVHSEGKKWKLRKYYLDWLLIALVPNGAIFRLSLLGSYEHPSWKIFGWIFFFFSINERFDLVMRFTPWILLRYNFFLNSSFDRANGIECRPDFLFTKWIELTFTYVA